MMMTGGVGDSLEEKRDLMAGMSSSALPTKAKQSSQSRTVSSSGSKSLAGRRQFRQSASARASAPVDSSSDCSSLPRPPRSKARSQSQSGPATSSACSKHDQTRTVSSANQRNYEESPSAGDQEGFFRNLSHSPSVSRQRTVLSSLSGNNKARQSHSLHSEGSVSIDSLSVSSGSSQKIAFSETNMQSSLGYLP